MSNPTRYYLAGPMTGYPGFNFDAFEQATKDLRGRGFDVASAHEVDHGETAETRGTTQVHGEYLRKDFARLLTCDAIILLPGWPSSSGVRAELGIAFAIGMMVYYYDELTGDLVDMNRSKH
jgi:hypothetical protein